MEEEIKNTNVDENVTVNYNEKVDIKGTISDLFKAEEAILSQEEAIKNYKEDSLTKRKKGASEDDEAAYNEEVEHLERVKKELLASLERVKKLEEKIFGEAKKEKEIEKLKIKNSSSSGGVSKGSRKEQDISEIQKHEEHENEGERDKGGFEKTRDF